MTQIYCLCALVAEQEKPKFYLNSNPSHMEGRMKRFQYLEPESLDEAVSLLLKYGGKVKVLAGGTDLVLLMRQRKITPVLVVDIKKIPNLKYIKYNTRNGMRIGALITYREITESLPVRDHYSALAEAVNKIGSIQTRNRGTIGGNLCNASPTSEPCNCPYSLWGRLQNSWTKRRKMGCSRRILQGTGQDRP